ncbi:nuclear transport factor 2 family protein [Nocardia sp. NPDC050378]|uniref:nuclear transport factor 2 family protein n=1 Tax=Nocardia sp. NPDC050378 TaxID=3155400 RepID=UPI0033E106C1
MNDVTEEAAQLTPVELGRLRDLLERDAIRRVVEGYVRGMDRCEEARARAAYWEDGHDNHGPFDGNAQEFVPWGLAAAKESSGHQHVLGQSVIEVAGDHASAETYFVYYQEQGRIPLPNVVHVLAGRYVDTLERRGGEWKIADRVVAIDWSTVWRSDERFPMVDDFVRGDWFPDDQIYQKPHSAA